MKVSLRPYQDDGIAGVLALFARLVLRVLVVLPTGGGKTVVAAELVLRVLALYGGRALFLAHRQELVKQAWCKLVRGGVPTSELGVIMSGVAWGRSRAGEPDLSLSDEELWDGWARRRPPARIQVGSIDTYRNKTAVADVRLLIFDEAHRALAVSYVKVATLHAGAYILGLTATPFRTDGKGLDGAFDEMLVLSSYAELVADNYLVAPRCFGSPVKADLSKVKRSKGDYDTGELAQAVDTKELVGDIVEHWLRLGNGAPTFFFGVNVAHSKHVRDRFVAAGVAAVHVDGTTPDEERVAAFRSVRSGAAKILCNCDVATEGTDVPVVKTVILGRPTLSERIYLQQVGRGSRPCGECEACRWSDANRSEPRRTCLRSFVVLDHAGCCVEFGLPHEPREYSLEGRKKKPRKDTKQKPGKECPGCYGINALAARVCIACGMELPFEEDDGEPPKEKDGELVELTETQRSRVREWNDLANDWKWQNFLRAARGERVWKPGAILQAWKQKTGLDLPPKGAKYPKLTEEEKAHNADVEANDRRYQRSKDRRTRNAERLAGGM